MPASNTITSYTPDRLLAGQMPIKSTKVTMISGEAARTRGAVLGRTATAATVAAAIGDSTNQANIGTVTLAGTPFTGSAKAGRYRLVCIEPATNGGRFAVEDPDGKIIGEAVVGTQFSNGIVVTINDGATDFVSGDAFSIDVSAVTYKYKLAAAAATDGSAEAIGILAEDCNASAADADALLYERGDFNENALTFGAGHSAASVRDALRKRGIYLIAAQPA